MRLDSVSACTRRNPADRGTRGTSRRGCFVFKSLASVDSNDIWPRVFQSAGSEIDGPSSVSISKEAVFHGGALFGEFMFAIFQYHCDRLFRSVETIKRISLKASVP